MSEGSISSLMNHVPQHGYNILHVIPTPPSSQKLFGLTSANHHLPSLLCCFPAFWVLKPVQTLHYHRGNKSDFKQLFFSFFTPQVFITSKKPGAMALAQQH